MAFSKQCQLLAMARPQDGPGRCCDGIFYAMSITWRGPTPSLKSACSDHAG